MSFILQSSHCFQQLVEGLWATGEMAVEGAPSWAEEGTVAPCAPRGLPDATVLQLGCAPCRRSPRRQVLCPAASRGSCSAQWKLLQPPRQEDGRAAVFPS